MIYKIKEKSIQELKKKLEYNEQTAEKMYILASSALDIMAKFDGKVINKRMQTAVSNALPQLNFVDCRPEGLSLWVELKNEGNSFAPRYIKIAWRYYVEAEKRYEENSVLLYLKFSDGTYDHEKTIDNNAFYLFHYKRQVADSKKIFETKIQDLVDRWNIAVKTLNEIHNELEGSLFHYDFDTER